MKTIKELPINERPYERCFENGPECLSDAELLAIVLRSGTSGCNAYDLANNVLSYNTGKNDLLSLMHLNKEQLTQIKGIGTVKTVQILAIAELVKRISSINSNIIKKFNNALDVANFYMERLRHLEQENLFVLYLDAKCKLIKEVHLTKGTINHSLISPREIFVEALKSNALNFILIHNHPSGDCTPSKDDIYATEKINKSSKLLGLNFLDHIIIGDRKYTSMKENGLFS